MTRWEIHRFGRALGTLSALPVRALSLPLKAGKRRCGLSFSQWFLLLGMGGDALRAARGVEQSLCRALRARRALSLLVRLRGARMRREGIGDLGPCRARLLLMTVLCTLWAGNKAGNLRVALFFWAGFLLAYLTAAQFRTRTERRAAAAALTSRCSPFRSTGCGTMSPARRPRTCRSTARCTGGSARRSSTASTAANLSPWRCRRARLGADCPLTKARRIALTVPLLLPCAAILLTYARTGWIMLALALVLLLWYKKKILLLPAAALGISALFLLPESLQARFLSMLDFSNASASGRFVLWSECLAVWKDHWLLGIGLGPENFYAAYAPPRHRTSQLPATALQYAVS